MLLAKNRLIFPVSIFNESGYEMAWSRARSQMRIEHFLETVPKNGVNVRRLDETYVANRRATMDARSRQGLPREQLVADIGRNAAVVVDGVHVYVQLLDFADAMLEQQRETQAGHQRALGMLHLHYAACDAVADEYEAQRVDFHGPRMHAVIATPTGSQNAPERARRALEFADAVKRAINEAADRAGNGRFRTRVRIGLDSGVAVAVNSGRKDEREPLFLGNPANYAAKLSEGVEDGIFPSNKVRREAGLAELGPWARDLVFERASRLEVGEFASPSQGQAILSTRAPEALVFRAAEAASASFAASVGSVAKFTFRRVEPPLKDIVFGDLSPSRSIRMELVSIFADINGFTAYVDGCIREGRIAEMVTNLHVMRSELAATLKHDSGGRKVRFIGDCVHGVLAEGDRLETDEPGSVRKAVEAASGMRSSFDLCRENLDGVADLGVAIGLELGATPITRIGVRGDRSVRTSVSKAVSGSESRQRKCGGDQTALGPRALRVAPAAVAALFDDQGIASGLDSEAFAVGTSALAAHPTIGSLFQPLHDEERAAVRKEGGGTYG